MYTCICYDLMADLYIHTLFVCELTRNIYWNIYIMYRPYFEFWACPLSPCLNTYDEHLLLEKYYQRLLWNVPMKTIAFLGTYFCPINMFLIIISFVSSSFLSLTIFDIETSGILDLCKRITHRTWNIVEWSGLTVQCLLHRLNFT